MSKLAKTKSRLGRGLSSLMSVSELPVEREVGPAPSIGEMLPAETGDSTDAGADGALAGAARILDVPVEQIGPNPHQPRRAMDEASVAELAASLKGTGLIQPIVVRRVGDAYQLIAGERRWRAAKLAGLATVPAILREVDAFTQAQMALVENIHRKDLNPVDRASAYRALMQQLGLTQAELAGRLGEDRSSIANYLRLLDLAEPVRMMLAEERISMGHAKLLAGVADVLEQERLANLVLAQGLSVRNLERLVQDGPGENATRSSPAVSAHIQDLEKSLSRQLGLRVQVRSSGKKGQGRLVFHYASLDQFDELLGKLGASTD